MKQNIKRRYHAGWLPIEDSLFKVETLENDKFVTLGFVKVSGKKVSQEMDAHQFIKGHEPQDIATRIASERFPNANPLIISRVWRNDTNGKHKKAKSK